MVVLLKNHLGCIHQPSKFNCLYHRKRKKLICNRRSIYTRYVDPSGGRQTQEDSNRQTMPPPPPPPSASAPALQSNQSNNTETSSNKLEESGGAKHIDSKLIEMITSEVI
jgi:hypothetical protein